MRRELLSWDDVDALIDHLLPQFDVEFDGMVIITRGGIVPGGLLASALKMANILTAAVDFPAEAEMEAALGKNKFMYWPEFIQFPAQEVIKGQKILVVDDVWGSGRTITAVKNRICGLGGEAYTCVLHFNPFRNLFGKHRPDYYAATTDAYVIYPWEAQRGMQKAYFG